jgi:hypothetical protein
MAHTEHLPIYKSTYDLCLYLEQVVHGFSRYHKYSLGSDLRDTGRRLLKLVVRANARHDGVASCILTFGEKKGSGIFHTAKNSETHTFTV